MALSSTFAPLHRLASATGSGELRAEFLSGASETDIGYGKTQYDETEDALVGYYTNLEEECGPVGHFDFALPYSEFVGNRVALAGRDIVGRFEDDLVKHGPRGAGHVRRLYEAEISRCEASALLAYDAQLHEAIRDALRDLRQNLDRTEKAFHSPGKTVASAPSNMGGRPLDDTADQDRIREIVWDLASKSRYQNGDKTAKPTPIRDTILNDHTEVYGGLSERALFDRVKRALAEGPPTKRL